MKPPVDVKGIKSFLGMASFYRRFIDGFATISEPLVMLVRKNAQFKWGTLQEDAFNKL
ncbi:RNase H-like protein, partial [Dinothrombium tinctorium]